MVFVSIRVNCEGRQNKSCQFGSRAAAPLVVDWRGKQLWREVEAAVVSVYILLLTYIEGSSCNV